MGIRKKPLVIAMSAVFAATAAYAATQLQTQIQLKDEITLSEGGNGHKPKIQRASDGTLVVAYGDSPSADAIVYDTKDNAERPARDIFVKWCKPDATKTCDAETDWTKATTAFGAEGNVSNSATKSSMTSDWKGTLGDPAPYLGDTDKPNIKTSGPVMVLTWTSKYCPNGNLQAADADGDTNANQRAVRYLERDERIIPFSCTWVSYSKDSGRNWAAPVQLSNGERDAKQDASFGTYNSETKKGQINISWQEDPQGLQLGEADGPGDGASGANVSNGTDVWYAYGTIDMTVAPGTVSIAANSAAEANAFGWRVTDNKTGTGIGGTDTANPVFNATGTQVDKGSIESGAAGASRPNIGMVGNQTVLAYEETKGSEGLDEGKFIRYHTFTYDKPVHVVGDLTANDPVGCIISDPTKNARRVRFLTQSADAATGSTAGNSGINIAIFWKEGAYTTGGPSDIMLRRGMVDPTAALTTQSGLAPGRMVPAVAANCEALDYNASQAVLNDPADNISSRADRVTATDTGLADNTEADFYENALAHRGVLRGNELWVGYNYTPDLVAMWNQDTNYNFWLRKFTFDGTSNTAGGSWGLPFNVSKVTDNLINVREPRIFGTPATNDALCGTDPTFCQNTNVVYVMWGSQENVNPYDPEGGADLGVYASVSLDGGNTFATPVRYSEEMGSMFDDDESAFETQPVTRPDGTRFYGMFNTENATDGTAAARYRSGDVVQIAVDDGTDGSTDDVPTVTTDGDGGGGGGCAHNPNAKFDPTLPALLAMALAAVGLRRRKRDLN